MEYFVYMTNDCNLKCEYCSVLLDCEKNNLPIKPAYSNGELIEFIKQTQMLTGDNEISIYFFGGEPSLCKFRFIGSPIPLATDQCFRL